MNLTVMRAEKVKSVGELVNRLRHATREEPPEHADASRRAQNEQQIGPDTADAVVGAMRLRWPAKRRKDAVLAIEYVLSASSDWWQSADAAKQSDFVRSSLAWLESKYGAENVVYSVLHRDEKTPHLSVFVVPERDGKLQAKNYIGNRGQMRHDQTTYTQAIEHLGIERGIERSEAVHVTPSEFYAQLQKAERFRERDLQKFMLDLEIPPPTIAERVKSEKYAERVVGAVLAPLSKIIVAQQQQIILQKKRINDLTETAKSIEKRYSTFFDVLDKMPKPAQKKRVKARLVELAAEYRAKQDAQDTLSKEQEAAFKQELNTLAQKLTIFRAPMSIGKALQTVENWLSSGDPDDEKILQELRDFVPPVEQAVQTPKPSQTRSTILFDMTIPTPSKKQDDGPGPG